MKPGFWAGFWGGWSIAALLIFVATLLDWSEATHPLLGRWFYEISLVTLTATTAACIMWGRSKR